MGGRILIVDDDPSLCELLACGLRSRGFTPVTHISAEEAFIALKQGTFDVALTDLSMPGMSGIELCERIVANCSDVPVVVMTSFGSMDTAVAAIRAGAYDFIAKPFELEMLTLVLDRAAAHRAMREKIRLLSAAVERSQRFEEMVGDSPVMKDLYDQLAQIADSETSILIAGESGTGKELAARALHNRSRRRTRPFVAINCVALPETLLESELFGHTRGAFTDARTARQGLFLQADGGTLLLDEIGDLPASLQPKLLRVLEDRAVRPIGGGEEIPFDVRIIAATNRDLETAVEEGRFRRELFFRINVIQVQLPPLRARGTDVLLLAQYFLGLLAARAGKSVSGLSDAVAERLLNYTWPGNVRELRNAVERAVALTRHEKLIVEDLPEKIRDYRSSNVFVGGDDPTELIPMEEVERRYILHVLKAAGDNRTLASRILRMDRKTLYRKLRQYGAAKDEPEP
jgi:DNA-binding NtrC family response regulator